VKRDRMQPRNKSKGRVRVEMRAGRQIVVKDYGGIKNPLVRLYGTMTLRNEARAYKRLAGIPGIPACHGITHDGCLELAFVTGKHLGLFKRRSVPENIFEKLERILLAMHGRGVANMDLHRSNVLVSDDGDVHVIDFAHAVIARDPRHPGIVARLAMQLDLYAYDRMKARFVGVAKPVPAGVFGIMYRCMKSLKRAVRLIKKGASQE
jgi:tRNA A-37 threonylcarbamoyl transferase component Bud32